MDIHVDWVFEPISYAFAHMHNLYLGLSNFHSSLDLSTVGDGDDGGDRNRQRDSEGNGIARHELSAVLDLSSSSLAPPSSPSNARYPFASPCPFPPALSLSLLLSIFFPFLRPSLVHSHALLASHLLYIDSVLTSIEPHTQSGQWGTGTQWAGLSPVPLPRSPPVDRRLKCMPKGP
jgi:hypothetical protein